MDETERHHSVWRTEGECTIQTERRARFLSSLECTLCQKI